MSRLSVWHGLSLVLLAAVPAAGAAQVRTDSASFAVLRGTDTIAVETFAREGHQLRGELVKVVSGRERTLYNVTFLDDASAPLVEYRVWRGDDKPNSPARQTGRIIFKEDSAAVDEADSKGLRTIMFQTELGAIPYLNLSFAFLEQATRRALVIQGDSVALPFFNLGGGQTVDGIVLRLGGDSTAVRIGAVEFRLQVDPSGRILGGTVPSQHLLVMRSR